MSSHIKPLGSRVLVKRSQSPMTKGGILLLESSQEKPKTGTVIAAGPGDYDEKGNLLLMEVQVGDQVLFGSYSGTQVTLDHVDEDLLILNQDEIFAIVK
ncbi:MAG: co-chaperone GroES [Simkaniaceae bacterium]|nr:co-chaperone GroES [Simkaniaceae bacterium]MCF7852175.1 co-chaperone GroES [Simkaniaceae bacterium]